jgi:ACS family sodium-dependent inorganic phosphate cotransporter-like MFS transporter 5
MGISNTFATVPGFVAPALVNAIATAPTTHMGLLRHQWRILFVIFATVHAVGAVFYVVFASGERVWWDNA